MSISAYMYINRGEDYNFPYMQSINSLLWCDEVIIGTDPRFDDPTLARLTDFAEKQSKIKLFVESFDYDNKNPQGKIKQFLREKCNSDWCLEMDADEVFDTNKSDELIRFCNEAQHRIFAINLKSLNFFNGNWVHQEMPENRTMLTRNIPQLTHHLDDDQPNESGRLGNNLMDLSGIKVDAGHTYPNFLIYHYGWYSLPRKWEMKQTLHYYEGALKGVYNNLNDYTKNLDDDDVNFWGLPTVNPIEHYEHAIMSEMYKADVRRFSGRHPDSMKDWIKSERVVPWGGLGQMVRGIGQNIKNAVVGINPNQE